MSYQLLDSVSTVQVFSATLVADALMCTIRSFPSGSYLQRVVPQAVFDADAGAGLLTSLSDAVESVLGEGLATSAAGAEGIDTSSLIYDAVIFTVTYVPAYTTPGTITGNVEVPVDVLTADTSLGSFIQGGTAAERILAEYNRLKALAGG